METTPILFLIDDDPVDQEVFRRALAAEGVAVEIAVIGEGNGAAAKVKEQLASTSAGRQALVVLDLNMPGVNGFEVLAALRAEPATRLTPVVVFSTSADREDVRRAYGLGANSYVAKPSDFPAFKRAVRVITDYWFGVATGVGPQWPRRAS